jgi:hypothetical protein
MITKKQTVSIQQKLDKFVDEVVEDDVKLLLMDLVDDVALWSTPTVDTGAYITSFSLNTGRGRPRGKSSKGRPRKQNKQQKADEARANLYNDVNKLPDLVNKQSVQLRNGSPHAQDVENKYKVFARVRREYG